MGEQRWKRSCAWPRSISVKVPGTWFSIWAVACRLMPVSVNLPSSPEIFLTCLTGGTQVRHPVPGLTRLPCTRLFCQDT